MSRIFAFLKSCTPPIILHTMRQMRSDRIVFEGNYASWEDATAKCDGYDAEHILTRVLESTLKVKSGDAIFERDSVLFDEIEYSWPLLAGSMWAAARNGGKLNVLDFGGALGSHYFQNRQFLHDLSEIRWNVVEQSHYVLAGQEHIQSDHLRFYSSIDDCLAESQPNVILLSSVLQYLQSPDEIISLLEGVGASALIIDRTPFSASAIDRLAIQNVPASICSASYPMWIFSNAKFEKKLAKNWNMITRTLSPEGCLHTTDGLEFCFQGMLLEIRR